MKTVHINLYSFNELNDKAKQKAISEHYDFLTSELVEMEGETEEEYTTEDVIDNILANDYIFFEDGSLTSCVTYTDGHAKAGKTEFNFKGRIYDITD